MRQLRVGDAAVLLDVVEERGGDGRRVELQVGDGHGGVERVRDVGVAGLADLVAVALLSEAVGFFDELRSVGRTGMFGSSL